MALAVTAGTVEVGAAVAVATAALCTIVVTAAKAPTVAMATAVAVADCCTGYTSGVDIGSPASAMVVMVDVGAEAVTVDT